MNGYLRVLPIVLLAACFSLFLAGRAVLVAEDSILVITHPDVKQDKISGDLIKDVFLGKQAKWANGQKIEPLTLSSGAAHETFLGKFVKKSSQQFSQFWKRAVFTGEGIPPKSVGSEEDMVKTVAKTPGALGYISASTPHEGVLVISAE